MMITGTTKMFGGTSTGESIRRCRMGMATVLALIAGTVAGSAFAQVSPSNPPSSAPQPATPNGLAPGQGTQPAGPQGDPYAQPGNPGTPAAAPEVRYARPPAVLSKDQSALPPTSPLGEMRNPMSKDPERPQEGVTVDDQLIVDLHVADEDLANVLEMLSIQSRRNIVASKNVSAKVTANLYGVTFYEALDAILYVNGYRYIEDGNFILIYTLDEYNQLVQANRRRVSKAISLNYLNAIDAAEFVKPLLSEGGQIKTNGKTATFPSLGETPSGADDYALGATLVVFDFEENLVEIERLLTALDTRPAQVLVESTILQTSLNENNSFGVDISIIGDLSFADFVAVGGPLGATNALLAGRAGTRTLPDDGRGATVNSSPGNTAGPSTFKAGVTWNDVSVILKLLDEVTDTTILSNPKILALNRQPARVLVGRKVGYLSTTTTNGTIQSTPQFLTTGTQLYIRPFVSDDGMIRMELKPQISEAVLRDTTDSTGATVTVPDELTNELSTNVMVRDGQTIVLGGLFRESTQITRRQVPFLGDIPIIGAAFKGKDDQTQRSEIIFLIKPTVMNDQALADRGKEGDTYIERTRAGAREGVMVWSRDRITQLLNLEAERLANEGNVDEALWKLDRSLTLNSQQPDAIALKEKLTGSRELWPHRSRLESIINLEINSKLQNVPKRSSNATPARTPSAPASGAPASDAPATGTLATGAASVDSAGGLPPIIDESVGKDSALGANGAGSLTDGQPSEPVYDEAMPLDVPGTPEGGAPQEVPPVELDYMSSSLTPTQRVDFMNLLASGSWTFIQGFASMGSPATFTTAPESTGR